MSEPLIPKDLSRRIHMLQMIWYALVAGSGMLLVVFWYVKTVAKVEIRIPPDLPLAAILAGVGLLLTVLAFVVPDPVAIQTNPMHATTFGTYQTARIIQGALLEAPVVVQGVAFLLTGKWGSLALGATLVLVMLCSVPTRDGATRWLQRHASRH